MPYDIYVNEYTPNEFREKFKIGHINSSPNADLFMTEGAYIYLLIKRPDGYELYKDAFLVATSTGEDDYFELYEYSQN